MTDPKKVQDALKRGLEPKQSAKPAIIAGDRRSPDFLQLVERPSDSSAWSTRRTKPFRNLQIRA